MAKLVQVALCTSDMPRTIRTFVEVLGFSSAGGRPRWGAHAARLQELPTGDDTYVMLWWLVGRQRFGGQIELFHHTSPPSGRGGRTGSHPTWAGRGSASWSPTSTAPCGVSKRPGSRP